MYFAAASHVVTKHGLEWLPPHVAKASKKSKKKSLSWTLFRFQFIIIFVCANLHEIDNN
jgi:hypothetical protein